MFGSVSVFDVILLAMAPFEILVYILFILETANEQFRGTMIVFFSVCG